MKNIKINSIGYYHPETSLNNDYFYNIYGEDNIKGLIESSGKENRFISLDANENALTMSVKACKKALENANITAKDIDFIVFVSATPEYLMPSTAIKLHHELDASNYCGVYDMNSNCSGMVVAIDQMASFMQLHKNMNRVLIVGSELFHRNTKVSEPLTHVLFGDLACAIILEKTDEDCGILDSIYYTNSDYHNHVHFPKYGLSNTLTKENIELNPEDRIINWGTGDANAAYADCIPGINRLLDINNLKKENISKVFLCQMFKSKIDEIQEALNMEQNKFPYIADVYGYTGVTSPILALAKSIENKDIHRGEYGLMWGLGAGITTVTLLFKY